MLLRRLLPWLGLAALGYGGYFYYQQQQGSLKIPGPNIFLGGGGPKPPDNEASPASEPTSPSMRGELGPAQSCHRSLAGSELACGRGSLMPASFTGICSLCKGPACWHHLGHARSGQSAGMIAQPATLADAEDTLRKQRESAAKLAQDFEGMPRSEPDRHRDEAHKADQAPFHEEELAFPRQLNEAASTSASVGLALPQGLPLDVRTLRLQRWWLGSGSELGRGCTLTYTKTQPLLMWLFMGSQTTCRLYSLAQGAMHGRSRN